MPAPPANSGFPPTLQIGQPPLPEPAPQELNIGKAITSSQHLRLRDRDEYLWDMLKGSTGAPEALNVAGLSIASIPIIHPTTELMAGLSVANGSFSVISDPFYWYIFSGGQFVNVHTRTWNLAGTNARNAMIQSSFAIQNHQDWAVIALWRLVVNGIEVARTDLTQGAPFAYHSWLSTPGSLSWSGVLNPGVNWFALQLATIIGIAARSNILAFWSPTTTIYME